MGPKSKKIVPVSWFLALCVVTTYSSWDALKVFWAVNNHEAISRNSLKIVEPALTELKRQEQKYFLKYGIYVPLEDIMFVDQLPQAGARYIDALDNACSGLKSGAGFAIWLPLKFKWPVVGERVIEWCWKPTIEK